MKSLQARLTPLREVHKVDGYKKLMGSDPIKIS